MPDRSGWTASPRSRATAVLINLATLAGALVVFFAVPVRTASSVGILRDAAVAFVGVSIVASIVVRQVRGSGRRDLSALELVMLAEIVACAFSLAYYSLAVHARGELHGVHTRLDALYFTMTTMTTVGYGDVHATGQLARGIVCLHLAFNLVFLGMLARLIRSRIGSSGS